MIQDIPSEKAFVAINGLQMYYEKYGSGKPLVLVHGGGSTIQTTFGRIIPLLAQSRQVIAMDMQAHGRTADRNTPLSFEQDADDVAVLLSYLGIQQADILGFSNGGQTTIELALRHPQHLNKLIIASAFYKRDAISQAFWDGFHRATLDVMPKQLQEGFLQVNNNQAALKNMFNRDVERMKNFKGWSDEQIKSIQQPVLIINTTKDVGSVEHAIEMYRNFPNAELVILPGLHGQYLGAIETLENGQWSQSYSVQIINDFLDK